MRYLPLCFSLFLLGFSSPAKDSGDAHILTNPFARIPLEADNDAEFKSLQTNQDGAAAGIDCIRGKPDRWIDEGHPEVAKAAFHSLSATNSIEIVTLRTGDRIEILNYGCDSSSVGIRYLGGRDKASLKDLKHWFRIASNELKTIHHLVNRQKGTPFDLANDAKALETAKQNLVLGKEINIEGDGNDFQQARVSVLSVEKSPDKRSVVVISLNRGPL